MLTLSFVIVQRAGSHATGPRAQAPGGDHRQGQENQRAGPGACRMPRRVAKVPTVDGGAEQGPGKDYRQPRGPGSVARVLVHGARA